jgi:hypothetical protein
MRKLLLMAAAVLAAVFVFVAATLPPAAMPASGSINPAIIERTVRGAYHVHSNVSDGAGTRDAIAAAAARAGLRFVIFTDHGDGTRTPDPPRYVHGVLCIDAVEISTNGGHYVAIDMRRSDFPLGGEASAVVEDVRRLGGFGIVAHPYSSKAGLSWTDWSAPVDGLEWLNADSEWRDEPVRRLAPLPLYALVRPGPALASILDLPQAAIERWDDLAGRRPVVALAGHDAHGGLGEERSFPIPAFPSYDASFRSFSTAVIVGSALTGSAPEDARVLVDAIRRGRVFSAIDGIAAPAYLDYSAAVDGAIAAMGDSLPFQGDVEIVARAGLPPGGTLVLVCGGRTAGESSSGELRHRPDSAMACRPEVRVPGAPGSPPIPWIAGNAIHLIAPVFEPIGSEPLFEVVRHLRDVPWAVEKDSGSRGTIDVRDGEALLEFELKPGDRTSQYVAAAASLDPPLPDFDRVLLTAAASGPMRVSAQLRFGGGERWVRSFYVEGDSRRIILPVSELVPADGPAASRPDFRQATSLLLVVDLTNARPGAAGWVRVTDVSFARGVK